MMSHRSKEPFVPTNGTHKKGDQKPDHKILVFWAGGGGEMVVDMCHASTHAQTHSSTNEAHTHAAQTAQISAKV